MATNPVKLSPWWRRREGGHGSLRGADSGHRSAQFEGRFGRIFRTLPAASFTEEDLKRLALEGMTADPEVVEDASGSPSVIRTVFSFPRQLRRANSTMKKISGSPRDIHIWANSSITTSLLIRPAACRKRT